MKTSVLFIVALLVLGISILLLSPFGIPLTQQFGQGTLTGICVLGIVISLGLVILGLDRIFFPKDMFSISPKVFPSGPIIIVVHERSSWYEVHPCVSHIYWKVLKELRSQKTTP